MADGHLAGWADGLILRVSEAVTTVRVPEFLGNSGRLRFGKSDRDVTLSANGLRESLLPTFSNRRNRWNRFLSIAG